MQISQSVEFLVLSESGSICSKTGQFNGFHVILQEVVKSEVRNEVTAEVMFTRNVVLCVLQVVTNVSWDLLHLSSGQLNQNRCHNGTGCMERKVRPQQCVLTVVLFDILFLCLEKCNIVLPRKVRKQVQGYTSHVSANIDYVYYKLTWNYAMIT